MNKYQVILVQAKSIVITMDGESSDDAINKAKQVVKDSDFESRIGARIVAGVREIERDTS